MTAAAPSEISPEIARAVAILRDGGVIACPTEGVFGLSCLPADDAAVRKLLDIKQRDPAKGLILIAANATQLKAWLAMDATRLPPPEPDRAITWIVPAATTVSPLVRGTHSGIAVRITSNPIARSLCSAADSPLVSTSANLSGEPTVRDSAELSRAFKGRVDFIVPGECGPLNGPSDIIDFESGKQLR